MNEEDMDRNDERMAVEDEETNKDASDGDEDEDEDTEDEDDDTEEDERYEGYAESSDADGVDDHGSQDPEEKYLSARGMEKIPEKKRNGVQGQRR